MSYVVRHLLMLLLSECDGSCVVLEQKGVFNSTTQPAVDAAP